MKNIWHHAALAVCLALFAGCKEKVDVPCNGDDECPVNMVCSNEKLCVDAPDGGAEPGRDAAPVDTRKADTAATPDAPSGFDASEADTAPAVDTTPAIDTRPACIQNADCMATAGKPVCAANVCVQCDADKDCSGVTAMPYCSPAKTCVACNTGGNTGGKSCAAPVPYCDATSGRCEACTKNAECSAATPVCRGASGTFKCGACEKDSECTAAMAAGVCLPAGTCPAATDVVWVKWRASCGLGMDGDGSSGSPFCTPQKAVDLAKGQATRKTVVIAGPDAVNPFAVTDAGTDITIIGKDGANVLAGANVGLRIAGGAKVAVRGLRIHGSTTFGVFADTGSTLKMSRSVIENNVGGLLVDGASYDIVNTVVAKNKKALAEVSNSDYEFAGALLAPAAAATPKRFDFNTVVDNAGVGVQCNSAAITLVGVLLSGNVGDKQVCQTESSSEAAPVFDTDPTRPYRLTMGSPCVDKGPSAAPAEGAFDRGFDLDGDKRPNGNASGVNDCGADELVK